MDGLLSPLVQKLSHGADLTAADCDVLVKAFGKPFAVGARQDLIQEGEVPAYVHLVVEGFACRYKILPDGGRQIVGLMIPGDFCDLRVAILGKMDHSTGSLTPCRMARINRTTVLDLLTQNSRINLALWRATLVEEAILREWLVGLGRRTADKQIAHLFCELLARMQDVGFATEDGFDFPLSQTDLSDMLGLTPVHVNRMLQLLRTQGLISLAAKRLTIPDVPGLQQFAGFDPNYLHIKGESRSPRTPAVKVEGA